MKKQSKLRIKDKALKKPACENYKIPEMDYTKNVLYPDPVKYGGKIITFKVTMID